MQKEPLNRDFKGGWAAMIQHYFVAAWVPGQDETNHYYSKALGDDLYVLGLSSTEKTVPAGAKGEFKSRLYIGPKLQDHLAAVAPHLELSVDYGLLTFIAQPIFWLLKHLHGLLGNWGWSIILLTMFIKLAFYKLSAASYRSMANMRRMQPKMAQIRERYGDDRQRMSQAMMDLYKKEKINPLGGCLPIVVQIPVFISLYWVLLGSVELRQADFIFWIHDLSTKDPYYVLPLIMGVSMFLQQRLSPAPPDPIQAKVMMALPVVFTLFFAFFPAGLVLYWVVNNVLSIAQQWYITRSMEKATAKG
jgi:YidC/Oxa1 family membrane protein insertase